MLLVPCLLSVAGVTAEGAPVSVEVPAEIEGRVVFIKASVNGFAPMTFIVDSGATETVITPPAARKCGVRSSGSAGLKKGRLKNIAVGEAKLRNMSVFVFDPPQALSLRLDKGINYSGILGYTFLSRFLTTIDYEKSIVTFQPAGKVPRAPAKGSHIIPFQLKNNLIHVKGTVNGKGPVVFLVDTGSAEVLLLPKTAKKLGIAPDTDSRIEGVGFATIKKVSIGKAVVSDIPSIIHTLPQDKKSKPSYDGIIGYPFLSKYTVTINYQRKIIVLSPLKQPD